MFLQNTHIYLQFCMAPRFQRKVVLTAVKTSDLREYQTDGEDYNQDLYNVCATSHIVRLTKLIRV